MPRMDGEAAYRELRRTGHADPGHPHQRVLRRGCPGPLPGQGHRRVPAETLPAPRAAPGDPQGAGPEEPTLPPAAETRDNLVPVKDLDMGYALLDQQHRRLV